MTLRKKLGLAAFIGFVVLIVGAFLVRWLAFSRYRPLVEEELRLFEKEGGSTRLSDMSSVPPDWEWGDKNPADYVLASYYARNEPRDITVLERKREKISMLKQQVAEEGLKIARERGLEDKIKALMTPDFSEEDYEIAKTLAELRYWNKSYSVTSRQAVEWRDEWLGVLERHLERNRISLELAKKAARGGPGFFLVYWDESDPSLAHLSKVRGVARILKLDACVLAKKGESGEAMENIRSILRLRRFIDEEPDCISKLVATGVDVIAYDALCDIINFGSPAATDLKQLMKILENREEKNRFTKALLGETASTLRFYEMSMREIEEYGAIKEEKDEVWLLKIGPALKSVATWFVWNKDLDKHYYLKIMRLAREVSRNDLPEAFDDPKLKKAEKLVWEKPVMALLAQLAGSSLRFLESQGGADTRLRLARTACALELYRIEKGIYPDTLEELVPGYLSNVQIDPFDGKPIRYVRRGVGYMLYGIGEDRGDNGGVCYGEAKKTGDFGEPDYDLVWRVKWSQ